MAAIPAKVNYRPATDPKVSCETCDYYAAGQCLMFDAPVSPSHVCDEWAPLAPAPGPVAVDPDHHNRILSAATARVEELEPRLVALLTPILRGAGVKAARAFEHHATDHLTASAAQARVRARVRDLGAVAAVLRADGPGAPRALIRSLALTAAAPYGLSTMIAVKPRPEEADLLVAPDGEGADTLHVTLAYLGELEGDLEQVAEVLLRVAGSHAPLTGTVSGYGQFGPPADVGILLPDVPGLVELRVAVTEALHQAGIAYGRDHGFEAHITVDTEPDAGALPAMIGLSGLPLTFDELLVVRGDTEVIALPFTGALPLTAAGNPDTITRAQSALEREQNKLRVALAGGDQPQIRAAKDAVHEAKRILDVAVKGPGWHSPAPDEIIDVDALVQTLRTKTDPIRERVVQGMMTESLAGVGIAFDTTNPLVAKALQSTGAKIKEIAETTQVNVMRIIRAAYEEGLSIPDTAKAIRVGMKEASVDRAVLIARTEMVGAVNGASLAATQIVADATGDKYMKTWLTAPGAKYPRHEDYDGLDHQTAGLDEPFDVGGWELQFPGDPDGPPEEVCNCFPGETEVAFPALRGTMRRWYEGDLIRVRFATGNVLTGTPNHPVLRSDGRWTPLASLNEGDHLVSALLPRQELGTPDPDRRPTEISEVDRLARTCTESHRVRLRPPDLHGNGTNGEVEVVPVEGSLGFNGQTATDKEVEQFGLALADFAIRSAPTVTTTGRCRSLLPTSLIRGSRESAALAVSHAAESNAIRFGDVTGWQSKVVSDRPTGGGAADVERKRDRKDAVSLLVSLAEIVEVEVESFHGFVFNLDTGHGWYTANGIVAANCRCTMIYSSPEGEGEVSAE